MTYYTRTYNPQPTARVTSQELKNEFQAIDNALDAVEVDVGKGVRAPEATTALPNAASRALKVLSFDASGNPRTTIAEVDLTAAAAAAALSESNAAASAVAADASADAAALSAVAAAASAVAADASADAAAASAASIAGGPVASVNGLTGVVTLDAGDVGAQPTLVSGTSIKTLNGTPLLGSGDITAGGVSPDSIVVLTSGTSWTCPAGVTKAVLTVVGGCGGKGHGSSTGAPGGGGAGGFAKDIVSLTPGASYSYVIGAAGEYGLWVIGSGASGTDGGASSFTVGPDTYTGGGGGGGGGSTSSQGGNPGAGGTGTAPSGLAGRGPEGGRGESFLVSAFGIGGVSIAGTWGGGTAVYSDAGRIILELYK